MKKILLSLSLSVALFACGNTSSENGNPLVDAKKFNELIAANPQAVILDVRTEEEFKQEYIKGALLAPWKSEDFHRRIDAIDKSNPIFIYCLSGGRSSAAAKFLREKGYTVTELDGGILKWKAAGFPVEKGGATAGGMSLEDFHFKVASGVVLVDFSAEWCAPCKRMHPILEELAAENSGVTILTIDVDKNPDLASALQVSALPTFMFYKDGTKLWDHVGLLSKSDLVTKIK
jgi:thioredoxin